MIPNLPLVGRDRELRLLEDAVARAAEGAGSCWLLVGEPGIGKSRLAEEVGRRARAAGHRTAWGRCWEAGGAPAFWPWVQVLRTLLRSDGGRLDPYRREVLGQLLPELGGRSEARDADARFELLDAIASWLGDLAADRPVWIGLEDLHAADVASIAVLEALTRQVQDAPLLIVATVRDAEIPTNPAGDLYRRFARDATVLPLSRLGPDDVASVLAAARADDGLAAAAYEATEGNPLFVVELARMLADAGPGADPARLVPPTVRATIRQRVERLDPDTQVVLSHASVSGRGFRVDELVGAFGLTDPTPALRQAADAALVVPEADGSWRFSHVLIPEVLLQRLEPGERARRHAALGQWLLSRDGEPCAEIAHHLHQAGPDWRARAAEASVAAGEAAFHKLAFEDAARHYARGREWMEREVPALLVAEGLARIHAGDVEAGQALCREAYAVASDPVERGEAALAYGEVLRFAEVDPVLVDMLEGALRALPDDDSPVRARCLARLAAARQPADDPSGPIADARAAIAMARRTGDEETLVAVLRDGCSAMVDMVDATEREPLDAELLALAEARGRWREALQARVRLMHDVLELGRLDEAWRHADLAIDTARRHAPPRSRWRIPALQAMRALWEQRLDDAERLVVEVEAATDPNARVAALMQRLQLHRLRGEEQALQALAPRVAALFSGAATGRTIAAVFHAQVLVWTGRPARLPEAVVERALALGDLTMIEALAEVASATGDAGLGRRVLERVEPLGDRFVHLGVLGLTVRGPMSQVIAWASEAAGRPLEAPEPTAAPVLVSEGAVWRLAYAGRTSRVQATKGVAMLAALVAQPGRDVHVLDLVHPDGGREQVDRGDAGPVLDAAARDAYRRRAEDLHEALADAEERNDLGHAERLRAELDALAEELARGFGLGGRERRSGSAAERARVSVRKRLKDGMERISAVHPELGRHLERSIRTGLLCRYDP